MRSLVLGFIAVLITSGSTLAQAWLVLEDDGTRLYAGVKPPQSRIHALQLGCDEPGATPRLPTDIMHLARTPDGLELSVLPDAFAGVTILNLVDEDAENPQLSVRLLVDGRPTFAALMRYDRSMSDLYTTVEPNSAIVEALRRGNRATIRLQGGGELTISLRGSARAINELFRRCRLDTVRHTVAAPAPAQDGPAERLTVDFGPRLVTHYWFEAGRHAVGFAYREVAGAGNSAILDIGLYQRNGQDWMLQHRVADLFGAEPRDVVFADDLVALSLTTLAPDDARCCPSGSTRYAIDLTTGAVSKITAEHQAETRLSPTPSTAPIDVVPLEPAPDEVVAGVSQLAYLQSLPPLLGVALISPAWLAGDTQTIVEAALFDLDEFRSSGGARSPVNIWHRRDTFVLTMAGVMMNTNDLAHPPAYAALCVIHATPAAPDRPALRVFFLRRDESNPAGLYAPFATPLTGWAPEEAPCSMALRSIDGDVVRAILGL